jgi:hypothetical protein
MEKPHKKKKMICNDVRSYGLKTAHNQTSSLFGGHPHPLQLMMFVLLMA